MSCNVGGQGLADIAYIRDFLQISIHFRIARYGQHLALLLAFRVVFVFTQQRHRIGQQRDAAHHGRLLARLVNPQSSVPVCADMLRAQVVGIRKGQPRQATEREHIPNTVQTLVGHLLSNQYFQLALGQVVFVPVVFGFEFVVPKRILLDPLVADGIEHKIF